LIILRFLVCRHEAEAAETSEEDAELLQVQLRVPGAAPGAGGRDVLRRGAEEPDPPPGAGAQVPNGHRAALHHQVALSPLSYMTGDGQI